MNLDLANMYNTPGRAAAEALQKEAAEKEAAIETFAKLAAESGIDISQLTNEQISTLWADVFSGTKLAELPPQFMAHAKGKEEHKPEHGKSEHNDHDADDKDKEKKEHEKKAAAELAEVQEEKLKIAMADRMGRTMAHAFVNELEQIKVAQAKELEAKTAAAAAPAAATAAPSVKVASHIDRLAVDVAIKLAADAKLDTNEVQRKLAARGELGFDASTKIASAPAGNLQAALEIRALEMLEQAGYPVNWK
jgi:hypothetical protein